MIRPSRSKFYEVRALRERAKVNPAKIRNGSTDDVWYVNYEGVVMESIRLVDAKPNQSLKPF